MLIRRKKIAYVGHVYKGYRIYLVAKFHVRKT